MSGTNVFGLLQPSGSTDPLAVLSGSPVYPGIAGVVSALYGPGRTAAQVAAQTVADPDRTALQLPDGEVAKELFNDDGSLTLTPGSVYAAGVVLYDNTDLTDKELVPFESNSPDPTLNVVLGGYFEIVATLGYGAFIVASPADGGTAINHDSQLILDPTDVPPGRDGFDVEDDVGVTLGCGYGQYDINETGTGFLILDAVAAGGSAAVLMTGDGSDGQIDVGGGGAFT